MSPEEIKGYADIVVGVLTASGFSAIVLAIIGAKKAHQEKAKDDDRPSVGMAGMAAIGGVLASEGQVTLLASSITKMAEAYEEASEARHTEAALQRASDEQNRAVVRRLVEELENIGRKLQRLDETLERRR